jgi:uncharacterized surface protein with fasciclin (FAS1) repeats
MFAAPTFGQIDYSRLESNDLTIDTKSFNKIDILGLISNLDDFSSLYKAIKATELLETLKGEGPFTIFAPLNSAFGKLPEATIVHLFQPDQKKQLTRVLKNHIVESEILSEQLLAAIGDNNGTYELATIGGDILRITINNGALVLIDDKNTMAFITKANVEASNGVIHVIDTIVLPE